MDEQEVFYVDLPIPAQCAAGSDENWTHMLAFASKAEAVAWIRAHVGPCDDNGNINLITAGAGVSRTLDGNFEEFRTNLDDKLYANAESLSGTTHIHFGSGEFQSGPGKDIIAGVREQVHSAVDAVISELWAKAVADDKARRASLMAMATLRAIESFIDDAQPAPYDRAEVGGNVMRMAGVIRDAIQQLEESLQGKGVSS